MADQYFAFAVLRKPNTGGRFIIRKLTIEEDKVSKITDNMEDYLTNQLGRLANMVEASVL